MKMPGKSTMLVGAALAVAVLVFAVNETQTRVPMGKLVRTCLDVIKGSTPDLTLKKCSGKYSYKDAVVSDAEQGISLVGHCPTHFSNFTQFSYIELVAHNVSQGVDVNDPNIYDYTGVQTSDPTRYKKKFFWWYKKAGARTDSDDRQPAYGMFKGRIKNGFLDFTYVVTKASQIGLLVTDDFSTVHNTMSTNKTVKDSFDVQGAITLGAEGHSTSGGVAYTAKKGAASGKLLK